jgi:hypothetical protein
VNTAPRDLVQCREMKLALLATLALATPAFADPCKTEGTPLVVIDHQALAKQPTSITTLFAGGGWTITGKDAAGKPTATRKGCLDKAALAKVEADVKAPWTVTQKRINCKLAATTWTVDSVNGKEVFTERVCGRDVLDEKSAAALADIHAVLDKL